MSPVSFSLFLTFPSMLCRAFPRQPAHLACPPLPYHVLPATITYYPTLLPRYLQPGEVEDQVPAPQLQRVKLIDEGLRFCDAAKVGTDIAAFKLRTDSYMSTFLCIYVA